MTIRTGPPFDIERRMPIGSEFQLKLSNGKVYNVEVQKRGLIMRGSNTAANQTAQTTTTAGSTGSNAPTAKTAPR